MHYNMFIILTLWTLLSFNCEKNVSSLVHAFDHVRNNPIKQPAYWWPTSASVITSFLTQCWPSTYQRSKDHPTIWMNTHFLDPISMHFNDYLYSLHFAPLSHPNTNVIVLISTPWSELVTTVTGDNLISWSRTHFIWSFRVQNFLNKHSTNYEVALIFEDINVNCLLVMKISIMSWQLAIGTLQ